MNKGLMKGWSNIITVLSLLHRRRRSVTSLPLLCLGLLP